MRSTQLAVAGFARRGSSRWARDHSVKVVMAPA
jgi:hypothetical protein